MNVRAKPSGQTRFDESIGLFGNHILPPTAGPGRTIGLFRISGVAPQEILVYYVSSKEGVLKLKEMKKFNRILFIEGII